MRKVIWWLMSILIFGLMFALLADIFLYMNDTNSTISAFLQDWLGGSKESYRAAISGFLIGSLLTHFTRWGRT
jgi:hypothetical protein